MSVSCCRRRAPIRVSPKPVSRGYGLATTQARQLPPWSPHRRTQAGGNLVCSICAATPPANTGEHCTEAKGERCGNGVLVAGNGLANDSVVGAMLEGYMLASDRALGDRLLAGL